MIEEVFRPLEVAEVIANARMRVATYFDRAREKGINREQKQTWGEERGGEALEYWHYGYGVGMNDLLQALERVGAIDPE